MKTVEILANQCYCVYWAMNSVYFFPFLFSSILPCTHTCPPTTCMPSVPSRPLLPTQLQGEASPHGLMTNANSLGLKDHQEGQNFWGSMGRQ